MLCTVRTRIGPGSSQTKETSLTGDVGGKVTRARRVCSALSSDLCLRQNDPNRQRVCVCSLKQAPQMAVMFMQ